jgi:hypothetical protein
MEGGENYMRKSTLFIIMLLMGAVALTVAPAFAEYNQSDNMLDQADNTVFGMGDMSLNNPAGPANSVGILADENPIYGPGTIYIPYYSHYGFPGCGTVNNGVIGQYDGVDVGPQSPLYGCDEDELGIDAGLILQDLFTQVNEGTTDKEKGAQGIAQYLDSLFAYNGGGLSTPDLAGNLDQGTVYINQTLDQDLADITAATNSTFPTGQFGVWQRLHVAFVHAENGTPSNSTFTHFDHDGIDQTMVAFLSEESGPGTEVAAGEVISYLGQWFQMGGEMSCADAEAADGVGIQLCSHDEFGGHGAAFVGSTGTKIDTTSHDP